LHASGGPYAGGAKGLVTPWVFENTALWKPEKLLLVERSRLAMHFTLYGSFAIGKRAGWYNVHRTTATSYNKTHP